MTMLRASAVVLLLAVLAPAQAAFHGNEKSQRLVSEGNTLSMQRQYRAALEKYEAAHKESPEASAPVSSVAMLLYSLAAGSSAPEAKAQVERARGLAQQALALSPDDPLANEVLRSLDDETPRAAYVPNAAAAQVFNEGEVLFQDGRYEAARLKYRAAYKADPKYTKALLMEGDTYFAEKNWGGAELMFQMAAEADPLDSQAWRFLADARERQGDGNGALGATLHAIAAMPSEAGNWARMKMLLEKSDRPMARLGLERKAWVQRSSANGKPTINMSPDAGDGSANMDGTVWLAYATALSIDRKDGKPETPFQRELRAWSLAFDVAAELEEKGKPAVQAPALRTLKKLHAAGELETAIFLLMYKEAYRPDFEAWKTAHPQAIPDFAEKWRLMP